MLVLGAGYSAWWSLKVNGAIIRRRATARIVESASSIEKGARNHARSPPMRGWRSSISLDAVGKQLGFILNRFRLIGDSPAALEAYLSFSPAINKTLDGKRGITLHTRIEMLNAAGYEDAQIVERRVEFPDQLVDNGGETDIDFPEVYASTA